MKNESQKSIVRLSFLCRVTDIKIAWVNLYPILIFIPFLYKGGSIRFPNFRLHCMFFLIWVFSWVVNSGKVNAGHRLQNLNFCEMKVCKKFNFLLEFFVSFFSWNNLFPDYILILNFCEMKVCKKFNFLLEFFVSFFSWNNLFPDIFFAHNNIDIWPIPREIFCWYLLILLIQDVLKK